MHKIKLKAGRQESRGRRIARRAGLLFAFMLILPAAECFPKKDKTVYKDGRPPTNFQPTKQPPEREGGGGY